MTAAPPARLPNDQTEPAESGMLSEAHVITRPAQPYVAISARVTMENIGTVLPGLHPRVSGWLAERGIRPAGPPFWRFNVIDMDREMEVEVAEPVAEAVAGDDEVLAGVIPAGRYGTLRYTGHPAGLADATASLLQWAEDQHLSWDVRKGPAGEEWAARLEIYETNPAEEPDMSKWVTQLAFRLVDAE